MKISKVLVTPVGFRCNLGCDYCYNSPFVVHTRPVVRKIKRETLLRTYHGLVSVATPKLTMIWHGGEPTLAGTEFFEETIMDQVILRQAGIVVQNCIQTNATRLTSEWCQLFKKHDVNPSISIDGPEFLHNLHRRTAKGNSTYGTVMNGVDMLREEGVNFGLLIVVTQDTLRHVDELFRWIVDNKFQRLDLLPCFQPAQIRADKAGLYPDPYQLADFFIELFDLWWKHDDPNIRIRTFRDVLRYGLGGKPTVCSWQSACSWIISVDESGKVFPCARFHGYNETAIGNISIDDLPVMLERETYKILRQHMENGQKECLECKWLSACGGGCPFARYALDGSFDGQYYYCITRKRLFEHIVSKMQATIGIK